MTVPQRQIRACYDDDTITVYQAYSAEIASAAVAHQKLDASPMFNTNRMTWIKPSWCWMMYRCGYSHKDERQAHVLAIKMKHEHFIALLSYAQLAHEGSSKFTGAPVLVQWDPERGPRLEKYGYRSIQIGVSKDICGRWVDEWIDGIEDVTLRARDMKIMIDDDDSVDLGKLIEQQLMPVERPFHVPSDIRIRLNMVDGGDDDTIKT